jgi:hypothetical protein
MRQGVLNNSFSSAIPKFMRLITYACVDLDQLYAYIGRDKARGAEHYVLALQERCRFDAESPFVGQAEPLIAQRLRQPAEKVCSFLYHNHRCYHLETHEEIRALGFIDTRWDLDMALEERLPTPRSPRVLCVGGRDAADLCLNMIRAA